MPPKSKIDSQGRVDGKNFVWTTEDGDEVRVPLRVKMKVLRAVAQEDLDRPDVMMDMLTQIVGDDQSDVMDEMDVNDFVRMFSGWNTAYNAQNGATLGESSGSSS